MPSYQQDRPSPEPFTIAIADAALDRIRNRVRGYPWHACVDAVHAEDWRYGPPVSYMRALCEHWTERYDWRAQERVMNAHPHFRTTVEGSDLHFVHERGSGDAPTPLLVAHGWPYSFHSYDRLVDQLAHPEPRRADRGRVQRRDPILPRL